MGLTDIFLFLFLILIIIGMALFGIFMFVCLIVTLTDPAVSSQCCAVILQYA